MRTYFKILLFVILMFSKLLSNENIDSTPITIRTNPDSMSEKKNIVYSLKEDSLALVDLYNSTSGNNWINNSNWLNGPVSSWYGVTMVDGHVTSVALSYNNLKGPLPSTIGEMSKLTVLLLHNNKIFGKIPSQIGDLIYLEKLSLNNNQLSGEIPKEIGNLRKLVNLLINNNQLSGNIPFEIGQLINLENLYLERNLLSGEIPSSLWNLIKLKQILFTSNGFSGNVPSDIRNLTNLKWLFLGFNNMSGQIPIELGEVLALEVIDLSSNDFSGQIPPSLGDLINLKDLNLDRNRLSGQIPHELGKLSNLNQLFLSNNQLSGEIPKILGDLISLNSLWLNDNSFFGDIPIEFENLINMDRLWLNNNSISGPVPNELENFERITDLRLSNNNLTDLPDFSNSKSLDKLWVENNRFTFEDIVPNMGISDFRYSPQDSVGTYGNIFLTEGDRLELTIEVGGNDNQYQWSKDGSIIEGATGSIYEKPSVNLNDSGVYTCTITNPSAPELYLLSRQEVVSVNGIEYDFRVDVLSGTSVFVYWNMFDNIENAILKFGTSTNELNRTGGTWVNKSIGSATINNLIQNTEYTFCLLINDSDFPYEFSVYVNAVTKVDDWKSAFTALESNKVYNNNHYNLISIPYLLDEPTTLNSIFEMSNYDSSIVRIFSIDESGQNYDEMEEEVFVTKILPGASFLVSSKDPLELTAKQGSPVSNKEYVEVNIPNKTNGSGRWAMLSNPFNQNILFDELIDQSKLNSKYNCYTFDHTINDWINIGPDNLIIKAYQPFLARLANGGTVRLCNKDLSKKNIEENDKDFWFLKLTFSDEKETPIKNLYVGAGEKCYVKEDSLDIMMPPTLNYNNVAYFINDSLHGKFIGDFRSLNQKLYIFAFYVNFRQKHSISLSLVPYNLPIDYSYMVVDDNHKINITGEKIHLKNEIKLKLIIGSSDELVDMTVQYQNRPSTFILNNFFPNPFNSYTMIRYELPNYSIVNIDIYNMIGQKVRTLVHEQTQIGKMKIEWNGETDDGSIVTSGVYIVYIKTDFGVSSKKVVFVK